MKLSRYFKSKAVAGVLAGVMALPAAAFSDGRDDAGGQPDEDLDISRLVGNEQVCASLSSVYAPGNGVERYLARQYFGELQTSMGLSLVDATEEKPLTICFDKALDKTNECGFFLIGQMKDDGRLFLNPAPRVSDIVRDAFTVHEARHRFQMRLSVVYNKEGNFHEEDRVVLYLMKEADARLAAILYAREKAKKGDVRYMHEIQGGHERMIAAFNGIINTDESNIAEASRAAMIAFLEQKSLVGFYAKSTYDDIKEKHLEFDPARPAGLLLDRTSLLAMGQIGPYGNYMNDEVIETYRQAYTAQDYQALKAKRESGQPACRP